MKKIVVVGANSNVGKQVQIQLGHKYEIMPILRSTQNTGDKFGHIKDFREIPGDILAGADVVLNCVGSSRPKNFRDLLAVNSEIPLSIVKAAKRAGVRHFIHISSIKVYGHQENIDQRTIEAPASDYGRSKLIGDQSILELGGPDFQVAIVRPPVLYGNGTGANFARIARFMMRARFFVTMGEAVQRSALHVPNLVSAIKKIIEEGKGGKFLVADQETLTLRTIAAIVSGASKGRVRILKIPGIFGFPAKVFAKETYFSLFGRQVVQTTSSLGSFSNSRGPEDSSFSEFIRETLLK